MPPEGLVVQMVVVVLGTVVGGTYLVVVVVGARVVVVEPIVGPVVDVVGLVFGDVVVVLEADVVVVLGPDVVVVEGFDTRERVGVALLAKKPTIKPDNTPEPMKTDWVKRRTRANRRSRCWGVR